MVFFYNATTSDGKEWEIFLGRDENENEDLIKFSLPTDVWFHVDDLSSGHVYVACPPGYDVNTLPDEVIDICGQIVKHSSIQGCKKSSVKVVYTAWTNLRKDGSMKSGQVGFQNTSKLKYVTITKKNEIVNKMTKLRFEKPTSSIKERLEEYNRHQRSLERRAKKLESEQIAEAKKNRKKQEMEESYADLFAAGTGTDSLIDNTITAEEYEQDFM